MLKQETLLFSFLDRIGVNKGFLGFLLVFFFPIACFSLCCWAHFLLFVLSFSNGVILVFIMYLEDLVYVGFGVLFIFSCASSDHCLFVGFYPSSHIVLLSPPLPSLPFRKMEEWLHYFWLCPGFLPQEWHGLCL